MILRCLFAAALAFLLGGCVGWVAETRLIPAAERDPVTLAGVYVGSEAGVIQISPGDKGFVRFADPMGKEPPADIAFDMLREEQPEPLPYATEAVVDEEAAPPDPDRSYLMEVPIEGDEGKVAYYYAIVRIEGGEPAGSFKQYTVLCSKAAEAFAARKEDQICIFDDYARLRAAALDALAWHDDARMALDSPTFRLQVEADEMEPDGF
jgi:hypothetical protein